MDFLRCIVIEMDNIKKEDYIEPVIEKETCDIDVGEASDYVKRLYTIFRQKEKTLDFMTVEYKHLSITDKKEKYSKLSELSWTCEILHNMISMILRHEFNLWDKTNVNLIRQFKVIYKEQKDFGGIHVIPIHFPL
jgi:hypothetical protein